MPDLFQIVDGAWVCPRHPDRPPSLKRGHLFCRPCRRRLRDAIHVPWPDA